MKPELSIKWARHIVKCTPENLKICKGKCCTDAYPMGCGRYYPDEVAKLPKSIKDLLVEDEHGYFYVQKDKNAPCPLIQICIDTPQYKPRQCSLWPFAFNPQGRVVMYRGVFNCPMYVKNKDIKPGDKTAFENCKGDLIDLFGEEWYDYWNEKVKE